MLLNAETKSKQLMAQRMKMELQFLPASLDLAQQLQQSNATLAHHKGRMAQFDADFAFDTAGLRKISVAASVGEQVGRAGKFKKPGPLGPGGVGVPAVNTTPGKDGAALLQRIHFLVGSVMLMVPFVLNR